jgi:hypothetical protein
MFVSQTCLSRNKYFTVNWRNLQVSEIHIPTVKRATSAIKLREGQFIFLTFNGILSPEEFKTIFSCLRIIKNTLTGQSEKTAFFCHGKENLKYCTDTGLRQDGIVLS